MNNIAIPDISVIIQNNKLDSEYNVLKELEETIIDLYDKKLESDLFNNNLLLLLEINKDNKYNIELNKSIELDKIGLGDKIMSNIENIVFTGSYIREILINEENIQKNSLKNELFINCIFKLNPSDLVDNTYTEVSDMYYKKIGEITIYIMKQIYKNPSEVILTNYNLKRIGYYNQKIYCSSMFIADYNRYKDTINSKLIDPIYNTKLDVFMPRGNETSNAANIIHIIDYINSSTYKTVLWRTNMVLSAYGVEANAGLCSNAQPFQHQCYAHHSSQVDE